MVDEGTSIQSVLANDNFVRMARSGIPAKDLQEYAPDRSIRWLQRACQTARECGGPKVPLHPFDLDAQIESYIEENKRTHRIPEAPVRSTEGWMKLIGDYAVVSDLHIPFYHAPTLERLMDEAENAGLNQLIIAGDLFDFNMFHHGPRGAAHQRRGQDDVELGRGVLKGLLQHFKSIKVFMGNHDNYLAKDLRNHFDADFLFSKFFGEFTQVKWSGYSHCDVVSGGVQWKVVHGAAFSETNPVGVAKRYAEKFNCNVIVGHQHRVEESHGKYDCYCIGGAHDQTKMAYLNFDPTPNAKPRRSFGLLKDGQFEHIYKGL